MEESLKKYFEEQKPLGDREILGMELLTDGKSNNHLNYKVSTSDGVYVARVTKHEDALNYSNLADEYTVLKYVESHNIGPRAEFIDLEYFESPLLIEEYLDGTPLSELENAADEILEKTLQLLVATSQVDLQRDRFPFKFSYTTYWTNTRMWQSRLKKITASLGENHFLIQAFRPILKEAEEVLHQRDGLLRSAPKEFIYNDVHPGNVFWISKDSSTKFIDWQKVSTGDPAFMLALFARRFGGIWGMTTGQFTKKVLEAYTKEKPIPQFEDLFYTRILERAVSDMGWSVCAEIKRGNPLTIQSAEENKYYVEARELLSRLK